MNVVVAGYDKMLAALISGAKLRNHNILGAFRIDRVKYSNFTLFFKDIFAKQKLNSLIFKIASLIIPLGKNYAIIKWFDFPELLPCCVADYYQLVKRFSMYCPFVPRLK